MKKYFSDDEFKCKCSANNGAGCGMDIDEEFKFLIYKARKISDTPFIITSGARCKDYNLSVGSKNTSSHTVGLAVDIQATGSRERSLILQAFIGIGVNRIGIADTFLHFDVDPHKDMNVTWLY